ncbi:MAG: efflux RND transporter periplasmic adaptor subunit [bacterium]
MKRRLILLLAGLAVLAVSAVFLFSPKKAERKVLYWTDPMMPGFKSPTPGKSPMGMEMVPMYEDDTSKVSGETMKAMEGTPDEVDYYTCPMHLQVKDPKPGNCAICSMKLVPVTKNPKKAETKRTTAPTVFISPEKQQLIGVKTSEVQMRSLRKSIRAVGRVDYDERKLAVVTLRTSAWIQDLFVDYTGKYVRKGDPLFTVYSPELVSAQQEYLLARAADREMNSTVEGEQSRDTKSYLSGSPNLLKTARERLLLWQFSDEQMNDLERTGAAETYVTIRSPISGYVTEKLAVKGMRVEPDMTLYRIADLSTVWINADVYEYELPAVKVGQMAEIDFPYNTSQKPLQGKIIYIFLTLIQ